MVEPMHPLTLAITLGDPGGIGAEVTIKALDALPDGVRPLLVGSLDALRQHAVRLGLDPARFVAAGQGDDLSGLERTAQVTRCPCWM